MSTNISNFAHVAVERLFAKGITYSTVIDVGCADGHFFLNLMKFFPDAVPLHVDANRLYETSLKASTEPWVGFIQSTLATNWRVYVRVRSGTKKKTMPSSVLRLRDGGKFSGQMPAILNRLKYGHLQLGRNEACPCGSGQKLKHCCGSYMA